MKATELLQRVGDTLAARGRLDADAWQKMSTTYGSEPAALEEELLAAVKDTFVYDGVLEETAGFGTLDPMLCTIQEDFIEKILQLVPYEEWEKNEAFPIRQEINTLHISFANPTERERIVRFQELTGCAVKASICRQLSVTQAQRKYLKRDIEVNEPPDLQTAADEALGAVNRIRDKLERGDEAAFEALMKEVPVLRFMRMLFQQFLEMGISDIHFEPLAHSYRIRTRRDGVLQVIGQYPVNLRHAVINRLKLMSGMNVHNIVTPQDGRIEYDITTTKDLDSRVSCLPSMFGEKIVIRLLDKGRQQAAVDELGFSEKDLTTVLRAIEAPNGLVLVTGPTGSGKSSTLYACLQHINTTEVGIFTVEDPVEYQLKGATQVPVDEEAGRTFSTVLRSLLRQDPDIIMLGEMRDMETADTAVKAALTGHLVLSTLHTNSAAGAITRLINMGVEPFLISSAVALIMAQRLVRRICENCKTEIKLDGKTLKRIGVDPKKYAKAWKGEGCDECARTGYAGRCAILEVLEPSDRVRELIVERASSDVIHEAARKDGMVTLREAALERMANGETTLEEVIRVTA